MGAMPAAGGGGNASPLPDHWMGVAAVREELHREFDGLVASDAVDRCFAAEAAKFHDARITAYVPILILRNARARLRAIAARPLRAQT